MRKRFWLWIAAAAAGSGLGGLAFAQPKGPDAGLAKVFADWKQRQERFKTARYTLVGTTQFKDQPLQLGDPALPAGDPARPTQAVLLLDLERKRFRLESSEDVITEGRGYARRVGTKAFDGKALYELTHREANGFGSDGPDLAIAKGSLSQQQVDAVYWPVFFAHGIVPTLHSPLRPDKLPTTPDPEEFEVRGTQALNGRPCLVIRTEPLAGGQGSSTDEYWVDTSRDGAIVRYVQFTGSNPWDRLDVEWTRDDAGWRPDRWSLTWTVNGKVRRVYKLRVERFEANPAVADSDFTISATPGMNVLVHEYPELGTGLNPAYPAGRTYHVSPSGAWEETSAKGFTTLAGEQLPPTGRSWVWWAVAAAAVVVIAAEAWVIRRRRMAAS